LLRKQGHIGNKGKNVAIYIYSLGSVVLRQMYAVSLENGVGVAWQNEGTTVRLPESVGKCGADLGIMPLIPERGLAVHWWHQVDLEILKQKH
jgi:hypothetical protein